MSTVIIGCSGTGAAIARRLARSGKPLHLVARNPERLQALASETKAKFTVADVMDASFEDKLAAIAKEGDVSGLVYAVGSIPLKPMKAISAQEYLDAFKLNFLGAAMSVKHMTPALSAANGSIVLFSTIAASVGFPNHCMIAAAKGSVEAFCRSAAAELSPKVRINAISPSLTDTPLAARFTATEAVKKGLGEAHPLGRLGTPDDLAAMAEFLLSNEASGWLTGQVFHVDGGRSTVRHKN